MMPVERVLARPISLTLYTEVDFQERLDNENPFVSRILSSVPRDDGEIGRQSRRV
jgi:hypothetical protein